MNSQGDAEEACNAYTAYAVNVLIQKIINAFADVRYPSDENLTNSFGEEAEALKKDSRGKTDWTLLTS